MVFPQALGSVLERMYLIWPMSSHRWHQFTQEWVVHITWRTHEISGILSLCSSLFPVLCPWTLADLISPYSQLCLISSGSLLRSIPPLQPRNSLRSINWGNHWLIHLFLISQVTLSLIACLMSSVLKAILWYILCVWFFQAGGYIWSLLFHLKSKNQNSYSKHFPIPSSVAYKKVHKFFKKFVAMLIAIHGTVIPCYGFEHRNWRSFYKDFCELEDRSNVALGPGDKMRSTVRKRGSLLISSWNIVLTAVQYFISFTGTL